MRNKKPNKTMDNLPNFMSNATQEINNVGTAD